MRIFPAIDIKDGKCVRLRQGKAEDITVYGNPLDMAQEFMNKGATWIHVVDLDGAFTGKSLNLEIIEQIAAKTGLKVQLGGGIRSLRSIEKRFNAGVRRVVLGTAAMEDPALLREAVERYTGRIAVGIDAKEGRVATHGWVQETSTTPLELALKVRDMGVNTIIYTDISKDGMLEGPNISATRMLCEKTGMDIIGSGGVHSMEDVLAFKEAGCAGVIIGKAIYDRQIDLVEVLERVQ